MKLVRRIVAAVLLLGAIAGVVYLILWKVIPVFASLFEGLGASLPWLTQQVVNVSYFLGKFSWLIFIVIVQDHRNRFSIQQSLY